MTKTTINKKVAVSAVTFNRQFDPIPRRIEFEGRSLTFINNGIRFLIKNNGRVTRLFDMSDGTAQYRLRCENQEWTLLTISR